MLDTRTLIGFAVMMSFTVAANLLLKLGAGVPESDRIVFGILGWKSMSGPLLFGSAGLIYAVVLRGVPLNVAQALMSGQFVGVVIAASLILREPISLMRWVGIGCISLGILLVGLNAKT